MVKDGSAPTHSRSRPRHSKPKPPVEDTYRILFENSRDALFVVDLEGYTIDANPAALHLTGYTLDELQHFKVFDLVPRDARESAIERLQRYQDMHGLREIILVGKDGRRVPVEIAVSPVTFNGQVALLGSARDIAERQLTEERLVRLGQRLLTLNEAGLRMQETFDANAILSIVNDELQRQRFNNLRAIVSDDQRSATVQQVSAPDWESTFQEATGLELIGYTFQLAGPSAQHILRTQQTLMIEDAHKILESGLPFEKRAAAREMFTRLRLTRAVLAPLVMARRVNSILFITGHDLQDVDMPAIAAFVRQAAVTLENARLYKEATAKTEEVAALNEIAAIVSRSLDLPAVLDAVLTQLRRVVDYDHASVYLDNGRVLTVEAARGYSDPLAALRRSMSRNNSYYQYLVSTREPLVVSDPTISAQIAVAGGPEHTPAWMGVPLLTLGRPIGFLSIEKGQPNHFSSEHARQALAFAQIAATAIENARLFDRERRALAELSALAGITEAGLSVLRLDDMLHELIRRVVKSADAAAGVIMLLDAGRLVTRAAVGLDPAIVGYVDSVDDFGGRIVATGQPLIIDDAESDPLVRNPFIRDARIKTILGVPLKASGQVVGAAHIDFKLIRPIEPTEIARFEVMADRAARAIENAQLIARISAHADELEQRVAERTRDLERAIEKAREADKLKSQLLSTVSHELRTPLASIKGYATTLLDYRDRLQELTQMEFLQIIDAEADRLRELVENLLDMSRIEAGVLRINPEPAPFEPVIERVLAVLQPKLAGRPVEIDSPADLPDVRIDADRIQQVLANLIDNAVKYSPPGSPIGIRATTHAAQVIVGVSDRGPGIPPEHAQHIFDRFYRIDDARIRSTGGIGLGLAICRGLIEAHDGRMWLESENGQGSTFYFSIPIARVEPIEAE